MNSLRRTFQTLAIGVCLTALYFAAGKLGLRLAFVHASATAVWPPAGIALAAFLVLGYRYWPAIFAGAFLVNITTEGTWLTSLGIAGGNTLEGLVGAYLLRRFADGAHTLETPGGVLKFTLLAALLSTMISASAGVASLCLTGFAEWQKFPSIWSTWWLGDATGDILVAPALIHWTLHPPGRATRDQWAERVLLLCMVCVTGFVVFGGLLPSEIRSYPFAFLCLSPLFWAAYRFGPAGAATANLLMAAIAVWGTLRGFGPFQSAAPNEVLVLLQVFMAFSCLLSLSFACVSAQRKKIEQAQFHLAAMVESSADAIFSQNPEGFITSWNSGAEKIFGFRAGEILGKHASALLPSGHKDSFSGETGIIQKGQRLENKETARVGKDGRLIEVSMSLSPIVDATGKVTGVCTIARDIGERKRMMRDLRQSSEKNRAIIDTALDAFIGMDAQGNVTEWNRRAEEIFGWLHREAMGRKLADLIIPEQYRKAHAQGLAHYMATGEGPILNKHLELTARHQDGHTFPCELTVWPMRQGDTVHFSAFVRDISERKRALRERLQWASIVESSEDAIVSKDLDGIIQSWNSGAEKMYGYSAKEAIGLPISIITPLDRHDEIPGMLEKVRTGQRVEHFETVRVRKDGTHVHVSLSISPLKDAAGKVIGASAIARDITEHKRMQESLRKSEERFHGIYNASKDAIGFATLGGILVDVNDAFAGLTGYAKEELLSGKTYHDLMPKEFVVLEEKMVQEVLRTGNPVEYETQYFHRAGGRVPALETVFVVRDAAGKGVGIAKIIKDITERMEAERRTLEAADIKNQFVSLVSHELRTPLGAIKAGIDFLLDGTDGPVNQAQRQSLEMSKRNIERLTRLADDVLHFQKIEAGKMVFQKQEGDINALIRESVEAFERFAANKGIALTAHLQPDLPPVTCDTDRITEVLANLLSNAVKFSPRGGTVTVGSGVQTGAIRVTVGDRGPGIQEADQKKLFQGFSQLTPVPEAKHEGSGLGLAICKKIIEAHGGHIGVVSKAGQGATFYFTLPLKGLAQVA